MLERYIGVIGPSGVGKTRIIERVIALRPGFVRLITSTTRPPRQKEADGVDYHFLTREAFEAGVARGDFLEHVETVGNYYGNSRLELEKLLASHARVIGTLDVKGARIVKAAHPEVCVIFLKPERFEDLEPRLRRRSGMTEENLQKRLALAAEEIAAAEEFDHVVISRDKRLDEAAKAILDYLESD